jgi:hypothetical protein
VTSKGGKAALSEIAHVMRVLYALPLAIMVAKTHAPCWWRLWGVHLRRGGAAAVARLAAMSVSAWSCL